MKLLITVWLIFLALSIITQQPGYVFGYTIGALIGELIWHTMEDIKNNQK